MFKSVLKVHPGVYLVGAFFCLVLAAKAAFVPSNMDRQPATNVGALMYGYDSSGQTGRPLAVDGSGQLLTTAGGGSVTVVGGATAANQLLQLTPVWAPNGPGWNGPSPVDDIAKVGPVTFNASSTPIRVATPKASGYTDIFYAIANIGTANGGGTVYQGGISITIPPIAPGGTRIVKQYAQDLVANMPVSVAGDATAGATIVFYDMWTRRRAP